MTAQPPTPTDGELLVATERLIVAPACGRFDPPSPMPAEVAVGTEVGVVVAGGRRIPVLSCFAGRWMGALVEPGQRVRDGQPLAWLRLAAG